ncbi:hypothetical protein GL4_2622 [Methyloceanibacter caenitepidi]|uniref:Uncharacterized protein n=1 Tax=Methyloceanibacter caenitepidi TaxID=1384459 RepID=A0A0A8K5J3_9HYPH|nr:hypothetical protein GL4_2622 [Methyloceanibacter caenitepidi]
MRTLLLAIGAHLKPCPGRLFPTVEASENLWCNALATEQAHA